MSRHTGTVNKGSKRAGVLGFPTVNIPLTGSNVSGIYAGKVLAGGKEYVAAVFADPQRKILEAYLLDFSGDLYGKEISIELFEKIRETKMFADDASLQSAIAEDTARVREYFKNR